MVARRSDPHDRARRDDMRALEGEVLRICACIPSYGRRVLVDMDAENEREGKDVYVRKRNPST
jgi:hypothetical protein